MFTLAVVLMIAASPAASLGLFFRTAWVSEVGPSVVKSWFDLIAAGRQQGPTSPYYVEFLAIQNIACNQLDPIGPPCNASAPTNSRQALGNYNMTYGSLFSAELAALSAYFHLFNTVYVGTLWCDNHTTSDPASNTACAAEQAAVAASFAALYGSHPNLAWYITIEGSLNNMALSPNGTADFIAKSQKALLAVRPWDILWSPAWAAKFNPQGAPALQAGLESLFCALPSHIRVHPQDFLGQSVTFEFPFHYNYTSALSCQGDSVPHHRLLQNVASACPQVVEVKMNMEMFAERLNNGEHGENNGANIITASPMEISQRMACYAANNVPIGASWALPHWFSLWTYANATVYSPY